MKVYWGVNFFPGGLSGIPPVGYSFLPEYCCLGIWPIVVRPHVTVLTVIDDTLSIGRTCGDAG